MGHLLSIPRVGYRNPSPKSKRKRPFFMRRPRRHGQRTADEDNHVDPQVFSSPEPESSGSESSGSTSPGSASPGPKSSETGSSSSAISGQSSCDIRHLERRARDLQRLSRRVRDELQSAKEARARAKPRREESPLVRSSRIPPKTSNASTLGSTITQHYGTRGEKPPIRGICHNNRALSQSERRARTEQWVAHSRISHAERGSRHVRFKRWEV